MPKTLRESGSSRVTPREQIGDTERNDLLDVLNSHGQSFLNSFDLPAPSSARPKSLKKKRKLQEPNRSEAAEEAAPGEARDNVQVVEDPGPSIRRIPDVIVFDECAKTSTQPMGRAKKGFMSSKITHVIEAPNPTQSGPAPDEDADGEEEQINTRNDKILHELVHSQLLNNTQAYDPNQGSAKRSRTVVGRLVELADNAKVGQGAVSLVAKEQARHAQRVRIGLREKAKEREAKALEEAKALGNYHPSIKRNFATFGSKAAKQRRQRGLALGIGKFRNGALSLSKDELRSVQGPSDRSVKGGKGKRR
ncbi:hypothetical protein FS749_015550 [Ceratobasidium sp. UAMH 11750]|nr:hypothetical protein FS749_015550 [Ceratobasidium sp. UAMH 11750]